MIEMWPIAEAKRETHRIAGRSGDARGTGWKRRGSRGLPRPPSE